MIEIKGVGKAFGGTRVLEAIDLKVEAGEFFCLLGPSGCGKTTLLRLIAGLEQQDSGTIAIAGRDVAGLQPHRRGCAMVFQNYALWPHLNVGENITYGLEVQGKPGAEVNARLEEMLATYQLEGFAGRMPHQLSGGQQQRVALARAMAVKPQALLMDEPLSNLDAALRKTLRRELLEFHRNTGNTVVYVTHDQEEALALADRMALLMDGRLIEVGKPLDLYARPRRLETALFLGDMNVFQGRMEEGRFRSGSLALPRGGGPATTLCIRPENVWVAAAGGTAAGGGGAGETGTGAADAMALRGTLRFTEFLGTHATLGVDTDAGRVLARVDPARAEALAAGPAGKEGIPLRLEFPAEHCLWY